MLSIKFLRTKLIAIKIDRDFPSIEIQYQPQGILNNKFTSPNHIYITQHGEKLFATFTDVEYKSLEVTRNWTHSIFHENRLLIFDSCLLHNYENIKKAILEKCPELELTTRLLKIPDPESNEDCCDYGVDFINLMDRVSLECMHRIISRHPFGLISEQDIEDYGGELVGMIKQVAYCVMFERLWMQTNPQSYSSDDFNEKFDSDILKTLERDYGSDLIAVVYRRARQMQENISSLNYSDDYLIDRLLYGAHPLPDKYAEPNW